MSITTKLDVFTLKIRKKGNKENFLELNDIAGFNLLDEISLHLKKNVYLFKIDEKAERTYRIEKNEYSDGSLYSRIKVGKFGESSEIIDTVSGSGVFQKEREHSDTIPLFFHIKENNDGKSATVHIQRNNNRSLLPELRTILTSVLESLRENLFVFELKPLKKSVELKEYIKKEKGEITSFSVTLDTATDNELLEPLTVSIKSKPRKAFSEEMVKSILNTSSNRDLTQLSQLLPKELRNIEIIGAVAEVKSPKDGKVKVELGNKINLTKSYTITSSSNDADKTGHINYEYLKQVSDKYMS